MAVEEPEFVEEEEEAEEEEAATKGPCISGGEVEEFGVQSKAGLFLYLHHVRIGSMSPPSVVFLWPRLKLFSSARVKSKMSCVC